MHESHNTHTQTIALYIFRAFHVWCVCCVRLFFFVCLFFLFNLIIIRFDQFSSERLLGCSCNCFDMAEWPMCCVRCITVRECTKLHFKTPFTIKLA